MRIKTAAAIAVLLSLFLSLTGIRLVHAVVPHIIDGIISPGEYNGVGPVQLVGRWDSTWKVDAYIDWDSDYLYVAVNQSVPATSGHISWIEFAVDPGAASSYLYAFVLFDDLAKIYDKNLKPSGSWYGAGSYSSAATDTATEFRIKLTDFGISLGTTIKISIDRNQGPPGPAPYGYSAFWPQNANVYNGGKADPSTWYSLYLPPPLVIPFAPSGSILIFATCLVAFGISRAIARKRLQSP